MINILQTERKNGASVLLLQKFNLLKLNIELMFRQIFRNLEKMHLNIKGKLFFALGLNSIQKIYRHLISCLGILLLLLEL